MTPVREFEQTVWRVEGIRIVIRVPRDTQVEAYQYQKAANQNWTLNRLIADRIQPCVNSAEVAVIRGDGNHPGGGILLQNLRASY